MPDIKEIVRHGGRRGPYLLVAFLSGMAVMILELTAARAMAPVFGTSIYTWTNVIGVVLLALALGYWIGGLLADRRPHARQLAWIAILAAVLSLPAPFLVIPFGEMLLPAPENMNPFVAGSHLTRGSLIVTLALFAPPLVFMGMIGPFVTRLLMDTGLNGGTAAGRTLAISTVGSLIGTWLPAHMLLDSIGVRSTLLVAAVLQAGAGLFLLLWARVVQPVAISAFLVVLTCAVFSRGAVTRDPLGVVDDGLEEKEVVLEVDSPYQYVRVSRWEVKRGDATTEELRLILDEGITEFHSLRSKDGLLTGQYYDYFALLPSLVKKWGASTKQSAAILGGGAGTMARLLRGTQDESLERIVSVEIDPAVAALGPRFGWEPEGNDQTIVADGRVFLSTTEKEWDLICLDAYAKQIAIPPHLASLEFLKLAHSRLTDPGLLAINVSIPDIDGPLGISLSATLRKVFPSVGVISVPNTWNVMFLVGKKPDLDFRLGTVPEDLAFLRQSYMAGLMNAPDPGARGRLLTDDRAAMERLARAR